MATTYVLTVVKRQPNPNYRADLKPWDQQTPEFLDERSVSVELTEAEWDRVREAVLREWESHA